MADRRPARLAALVDALDRVHLDAVLVTSLPNIRYLTGFSGSSALLVVSRREVLFVSDFRYLTQASAEVGAVARVSIQESSLWAGLWQLLPQLAGIEAIGFESASLLHRDFQRLLESGTRWQWRPTADLVEALRERKDAGEVAAIRAAGAMATEALARTLDQVRPGMTELAVAGLLEKALRDAGSEDFPFPCIVASGERAALPHARPSTRTLAAGDLLLLDFGAESGGYCADVTRTVAVGPATDRQREIHAVVQGAQAVALAGIRAGMTGRDADALARGYIERAGFGAQFGHGLGHGLGLEVHEAPRLSRVADAVLSTDAVVTIEPGIYVPGWGGVRIEDDVHLAVDGPETLTHFTRDLLQIA
ncbi:MAG TPA: Xaa-Pro peptidase family protein [Gemmatimonadaceae bacterium]|nr:Xaa-Pro peptidase family protein [Gemmatimonadaceae bacterium]